MGITQLAWLKHLPLGELRGANGMLGPMDRFAEMLGSHLAKESREAATFTPKTQLLQAAAENKEGSAMVACLEDGEEIATAVSNMLCATASPTMLMRLHAKPGETSSRPALLELRQIIAVWSQGETASEQW